jgi:hypothetical protein
MDLKKLQFCFKTGSFLSLTPPSLTSLKPTILERLYILLVFSLYTVAVIWNKTQKMKFYATHSSIKLILHLMVDLNLCCHTCYTLVLLLTTKRRQWFKLVNGLSKIERFATTNTNIWMFVVVLVIFWAVSTLTAAVWIYFFGWNFFKIYVVEFVQVYSQFFHMVLACIVLNMVLERYKVQSCQIKCGRKKRSRDVVKLLKQVKFNVFVLKQAVDAFNEIFGWVILFNIFFGCSKGLAFIDSLVNSTNPWSRDNVGTRVLLSLTKHSAILTYCVRFVT